MTEHILKRMRDLRKENNLTQATVAAALHISKQQYSNYETGNRYLSLECFISLTKFYDVSADYLIGRTDFPNPSKLKRIYINKGYSCYDLLHDVLSLDNMGKIEMEDYIRFLKTRTEMNDPANHTSQK